MLIHIHFIELTLQWAALNFMQQTGGIVDVDVFLYNMQISKLHYFY